MPFCRWNAICRSVVFGLLGYCVLAMNVRAAAPFFASHPQSQQVCIGHGTAFSAQAWGAYIEWRFNETNWLLGGFGASNLVIQSVALTHLGNYTAIASNNAGMVTSMVATLSLDLSPPGIAVQPFDQQVPEGYAVGFNQVHYGCPPFAYQWRFNGQDIPAPTGTNENFGFQNVLPGHAGAYDVVVSNPYGSVTSAVATLIVPEFPPRFVLQPRSDSQFAGSPAYFSAEVTGGPRPTVQWQFNGQNILNATDTALTVPVVSSAQAGDYRLIASNRFGLVTSEVARLTVRTIPPSIVSQPADQSAVAGGKAEFHFSASGQPVPVYQWFYNGQLIPGNVASLLTLTNLSLTQAGDYSAVAGNEGGSVTSRVARLEVIPRGPVDKWTWRRPLPQGNDLEAVAFGNGRYVAVGDNGAHVSSSDGLAWETHNRDLLDRTAIAFGNGVFVAISAQSIETSIDGRHWTPQSWPASPNTFLRDLTFRPAPDESPGEFLIAADGFFLLSIDAANWQRIETPFLFPSALTANADQFLALSANGILMSSFDAIFWWTEPTVAIGLGSDREYRGLACLGSGQGFGTIVAIGSDPYASSHALMVTGQRGGIWQRQTLSVAGWLNAVCVANQRFVAVGGGITQTIITSTDGLVWQDHSPLARGDLLGVTHGGGRFVAVGKYGSIVTSVDGNAWTPVDNGSNRNLRDAAYGAGRHVVVGNEGLLLTSTDGVNWLEQPGLTSNNLRGIVFADNRFVAVGGLDGPGGAAAILSSIDGLNWESHSFAFGGLYAVTHAEGLFVATGETGIATSVDGASWVVRHTFTSNARQNAIAYGGGRFVSVGAEGNIFVSDDGLTWLPASNLLFGAWQGVAYGNGIFVVGGKNSFFFVSSNAVSWTQVPRANRKDIEDIIFADGQFVATGEDGVLLTSPDGRVWISHETGTRENLRALLYAEDRLLAVGNNEIILQSAHFAPATLTVHRPDAMNVRLTIEGEAGRGYILQSSTNFIQWDELMRFTNALGCTNYLAPIPANPPRRFYRTLSP